MELLYNPDQMPEEEIKATFVAREQLVDELVELIESQPEGAGVQHAVIIAPRGMGKTTVMLMVKFALKDHELSRRWQAVKFPEELYGINDLADLWVETLGLISSDTADQELQQLADDLKKKYSGNDELQEAAYAALMDWRRKHGKRLLLLVENFDLVLEQINDERDNARLRDYLINDDTVMIIGGATTFFKEARAYDLPLYNLFKIYNLADLKSEQIKDLLLRRAKIDKIYDFASKLKQNISRLRALEYFTGGNPRLVLMLYRVVSRSNVTDVQRALVKLLDEVSPYYKAKIESLPAQQRKILDCIARISSETNQGLTPSEIAIAVRLSPNHVSSQLKRLSEIGYVRAANLRGRHSYYALSELLYALWHQMRFGRNAKTRMEWLVNFLKVWYDRQELVEESNRLIHGMQKNLDAGRFEDVRNVVVMLHYLVQVFEKGPSRDRVMDEVILGYLKIGENRATLREVLETTPLENLSPHTVNQLIEAGVIRKAQDRGSINIDVKKFSLPRGSAHTEKLPDIVEAYLRADENLTPESAQALAELFRISYMQFSITRKNSLK